MFGYGGKLVPADRVVRAIVGVGLVSSGFLAGWSPWAVVLGVASGGLLLTGSTLNYCPIARILPWNRV